MSRVFSVIGIVLATSAAGFAQSAPSRVADHLNLPTEQINPVSQVDPGWCAFDVEKRTLIAFPPKAFSAPIGQTCSVICSVSGNSQVIQFGCDTSAPKLTDGTICSRSASEIIGTIRITGVELVCEVTSP